MSNGFRYHAPVDPDCPEVAAFFEGFWDDPITVSSGVGGEISEDFENKHRAKCERCKMYGAENIEVVGP